MATSDDLDGTTFKVYLYLLKAKLSVGPRGIMRGLQLSSPSVAYRHLQKLIDLELVEQDRFGNYLVKEKVRLKGFTWIGTTLIPRLMIYAFFFVGALIIECVVLSIRLIVKEPLSNVLVVLIVITGISTVLFFFEGIQLKRKIEQ